MGALAGLHAIGDKLSSLGAAIDPFSATTPPHTILTIENGCDWHVTDTQSSCAYARQ
jgi:hypothetical protein